MKTTKKVKGIRKKQGKKGVCYKDVIRRIKAHLHQRNPRDFHNAIATAYKFASTLRKKQKVKTPRVIPVPKTGGILPLIPIFAGLSALGALSGGAAGIAKAVNDAKAAKQQLEESQRHNKAMEALAIGGRGLYLKPYKSGLGLFLRPAALSGNFR